jgi:hypothetical protein
MLFLQIGLVFLGCWLMTRKRLQHGDQELCAPFTFFAGLILAMQMPIALTVGFAVGGAEGIKAVRKGLDTEVTLAKVQKQYGWLDYAIPGLAVVLAGGVVLAGAREVAYVPPLPDEPLGITDHRLKYHGAFDDPPGDST